MVAFFSSLLLVVQYAVVHHGVEAVDDAGPADGALKLRLDMVPHLFAFGAFTDGPEVLGSPPPGGAVPGGACGGGEALLGGAAPAVRRAPTLGRG